MMAHLIDLMEGNSTYLVADMGRNWRSDNHVTSIPYSLGLTELVMKHRHFAIDLMFDIKIRKRKGGHC